jgi:hypothetical protein
MRSEVALTIVNGWVILDTQTHVTAMCFTEQPGQLLDLASPPDQFFVAKAQQGALRLNQETCSMERCRCSRPQPCTHQKQFRLASADIIVGTTIAVARQAAACIAAG